MEQWITSLISNPSDMLRVAAIAAGCSTPPLLWYIVYLFRSRMSLDADSGLMTSYAAAVSGHIIPTAIGVTLLILAGVAELFGRVGLPLSWRSPTYLTANLLLLFSLVRFMRHQAHMLAASRNFHEEMMKHHGKD